MEIDIKLTVDEVQFIMNVLGDLPTKSGVWNLAMKIKQQADTQMPTESKSDEKKDA